MKWNRRFLIYILCYYYLSNLLLVRTGLTGGPLAPFKPWGPGGPGGPGGPCTPGSPCWETWSYNLPSTPQISAQWTRHAAKHGKQMQQEIRAVSWRARLVVWQSKQGDEFLKLSTYFIKAWFTIEAVNLSYDSIIPWCNMQSISPI